MRHRLGLILFLLAGTCITVQEAAARDQTLPASFSQGMERWAGDRVLEGSALTQSHSGSIEDTRAGLQSASYVDLRFSKERLAGLYWTELGQSLQGLHDPATLSVSKGGGYFWSGVNGSRGSELALHPAYTLFGAFLLLMIGMLTMLLYQNGIARQAHKQSMGRHDHGFLPGRAASLSWRAASWKNLLYSAIGAESVSRLQEEGARCSETVNESGVDPRIIERDLRGALARGEFSLAYQPQFQTMTGEVRGLEALLRWNHPVYGQIPPDDFIPTAERVGLIVELGRMVLQRACAEAASWRLPVKIAVNLSPLQLESPDILKTVVDILEQTGLDPARLELEITETVLLSDMSSAARILKDMRSLGVTIAIDDFGTGYSSLSALRHIPVDTIKLDKSFLEGITLHSEAKALVKLVIDVGAELGKTVIIEGVETEAQHQCLLKAGYQVSQGFLFARPVEASRLGFLH